ncbi:MAG TPA: FAD-dependent oxidoreductase [Longimicrobiales bacterium]|nr:FAD-dependent oxidoreductase [Longimicrobiales bacterium]
MGSGSTEPKGPDLTAGVAAELVGEGIPFAGHVGEDAVLLVRAEGEVYAIGATCTHYGAPLEGGLVIEGEIRCPWHHACFALRTGDVVRPPALNPLPRWHVEQRGGQIFVHHKYPERDALVLRDGAHSTVRSVVIVGGGAAGTSVAETLRVRGFKGIVTIVDPDADAPYDRPNLSKDYLAGSAPEEWLPLRPADFHAQHGIRRIADAVTAIDVAERRVALSGDKWLSYDALVLAMGSAPVRPPIPGADFDHVHVLRTVRDCRALIAGATARTEVVIAGASFIGMEAAAALRQRKVEVTIVAPEMIPFSKILGPTIGGALVRLHEQHGVRFRLGKMLRAIERDHVVLDDGTAIKADLVLLGIGVRPRVEIAQSAGIEVDRGIVVNEQLETSAPGVYAVGDVARYPDARSGRPIRIEHWVVAQRQGQVAAANILGAGIRFTSVPFFWTQQYDMTVNYVGHAEDWTHINVDGSPEERDCAASFMDGERLLAYVSIGRDRESLEAERKLELGIR